MAQLRDLSEVLERTAADVDASGRFPVEAMEAIRSSGLLGLLVPRSYGGSGGDVADLVEIATELGGHCMSTAMVWAMHCQQVQTIARHAPHSLIERVLPAVARGELYIASMTTDSTSGGDLLSCEAAISRADDVIHITRECPVVTGARYADAFLMTMRTSASEAASAVTFVYASREQVDVEVAGSWAALGLRGTDSVSCRLDGRVPPDQVFEGDGRRAMLETFVPAAHLGWAACWLGSARRALANVVSQIRHDHRKRTLTSELKMAAVGRSRMEIELAASYLRHVCEEVREAQRDGGGFGDPAFQIHLDSVKVAVGELCYGAVDRLIGVVGLRDGYLSSSTMALERHMRDLRSAPLNYSNDRLMVAIGSMAVLDRRVTLCDGTAQ